MLTLSNQAGIWCLASYAIYAQILYQMKFQLIWTQFLEMLEGVVMFQVRKNLNFYQTVDHILIDHIYLLSTRTVMIA